jgi:zinc protease
VSDALRTAAGPVVEIPIVRSELSCGARLLVSPRPGAPVTSIKAHLRGGHSLDPVGREGTAFLAGGLADQGTGTHTEEELAELLEPAGGGISGDATGLSGSVAADRTPLLLELFCEVLTDPAYPRAKIERQRSRLLEKLHVERSEPRVQAARLFRQLVYGDHWLGHPVQGTVESVEQIQRRHLVAHHKKHWVASRAVIAVCGDVDAARVHRKLDRLLRGWEPGRPLSKISTDFPDRGPRAAAFQADRKQVHLYLGHLGVRRADPLYEALVVMDHVLGTGPGFTNRISRILRDEMGLAYTVHAAISSSASVLPGTFEAYIGTAPEKVGTAVAGFVREVRRIQDEPVGEEELELAKSYLIGSLALGYERASRRVAYMVAADRFGLPDDHLARLPERYAAIGSAEVQEAARRHLHPERAVIATGGPVGEREVARLLRSIDS